jgi:hypothetical protein
VLALAVPGVAAAQTPVLLGASQQERHPSATFSAPGADDAIVYVATKPNRATDGTFLQENIAAGDFLTAGEVQSGRWTYESQLDPGTYYVMMWAIDDACLLEPGCLSGHSNVVTLTVPKPPQTFRGSVMVLRGIHLAYLSLRVKPLGGLLPYKVCWRLKNKKQRCVRDKVDGYDWNDSATGLVTVALRGMARRTTFTWYVQGVPVASKYVRIR